MIKIYKTGSSGPLPAQKALRVLGRYAEARDLDQDTLDRERRILGADHPDTLSSAGNLAADLRALAAAHDES